VGAESSPKLVEDSPLLLSLHHALPMRKAGAKWIFADHLGKAFSEKPLMERSALSGKSAAIDGASRWCEAVAGSRMPSGWSRGKAEYNLCPMSQEQTGPSFP
jgi:hypothetical protein